MRYLAGRFITFFLTAYLLAGCLSCASTPLPASVIDNTCPPPCWAGITPRASTLPQAQSIIRSLSDVDLNSIKQGQDYHQESDRDESGNPRDYERSRLMLSWNFSTTITHNGSYTQNWLESGGAVYFDNDQVDEIDLAVPHASGLSIATAIKRFGPPTKVLVCNPGGELADFVKLIYPTQGLVLSVYNTCPNQWSTNSLTLSRDLQRSEERRVGKEC